MTSEVARAQPIFFGPPQGELFGMLHPASNSAPARPAVLLCNPFGQEAIRAHRTFKVLAERLARAGHPTLRFDYRGSGDSSGDDTDVTIDSICGDIAVADKHLREMASGRSVLWLGLRFGATAAWLTAANALARPDCIVLWDPILDGPRYLEELFCRHREFLDQALSLPVQSAPPANDLFEAGGFSISSDFKSGLSLLTVDTMPSRPPGLRTILVSSPADSQSAIAAAYARSPAVGCNLRHVEASQSVDWLVEGIDAGSIVPARTLQSLVALAGECFA